jgi:two-component system LytT family response regulator
MRALIVDDEELARTRLRRLLAEHPDVDIVGEASHGQEALERIAALSPDIVFLDIEMPGVDGLHVAESTTTSLVVFTTSHTRYGVDAFEANALDYLIKPISRERLGRALTKARTQLAIPKGTSVEPPAPWRLVVTDGPKKRFIDAREVDCFVSDQKYVTFRIAGEQLLLRDSLDSLEERLGPLGFIRAHRGALVRIDAVTAFDTSEGGSLVLRDGTSIPVSRRAVPAVRSALGLE